MKKTYNSLFILCFLLMGLSLKSFSQGSTLNHKTEMNCKVINRSGQEDGC